MHRERDNQIEKEESLGGFVEENLGQDVSRTHAKQGHKKAIITSIIISVVKNNEKKNIGYNNDSNCR